MSYVRVWIHAVWGTKERAHCLTKDILPPLLSHIRENASKKEIHIDSVNGSSDHLHCLFGLNADMPIAKAVMLIKGDSAHWINDEKLTSTHFEWANEYYAVSVSESALERVSWYINGQEEHHRKRTFAEEVDILLQECHLAGQG